jgi:hypothetical protein
LKIARYAVAALDWIAVHWHHIHMREMRRLDHTEIAAIAFAIGTLFGILLALAVQQVSSH